MNLWELIKKGAEEGLEVLKDSVTVAGKTSRILKKRVELTAVQGNVRKVFIRLGSLTYELHSQGEQDFYENEEVKGLMTQIEGHEARVKEIESEIEAIRRKERRKVSETVDQQPPIPQF